MRKLMVLGLWGGLALPGLLFLPWFGQFLFLRGAGYSDLLISHYPNLQYLHDAVLAYRTVPLWSPAIQSGFPFFANPLSGLWYPPGWLTAVWPAAWAFNLLAALHLVFGAWGMARMLRLMGLQQGAQVVGGLAFGMLPKLLAHVGAGHVTLVYALSWTPWLLAAELQRGRLLRPGVVLAVIFLADPRWAAYAGALWLAFSVAYSHAGEQRGSGSWLHSWVQRMRAPAVETGLALLLSSPLLLPLLEYTARSTRAGLAPEELLAFSLPPARLFGLLLPQVGGQVEWVLYPGIAVLALAVLSMGVSFSSVNRRFWWTVAACGLLLALGDQVPVLRLWAWVPGANLLRVPARALFLFHFSLIVLSAGGFQGVACSRSSPALKRLLAGWMGLSLALLAAGLAVPALRASLFWSGSLGMAGGLAAALRLGRRIRPGVLSGFFVLLVFADGAWFFGTQLAPRTPEAVFREGAAAAAWLVDQPGRFRVYSPSYSIPQQTAARYGLELADGVDPLQLESYVDYFSRASGVPYDEYGVTLPPFDGDVSRANAAARPAAELLGRLNVRFVASAFALKEEGLEPVRQIGGVWLYRNLADRGRVYPADESSGGQPEILEWTPNRIVIDPGGSRKFILAEMDYPGWTVQGGTLLSPAPGNLRVIAPEDPEAAVTLHFRPLSLILGLLLALAGGLAVYRFPAYEE